MRHVVVDKRLREKFIHVRAQRIAANRPLVVDQHADDPMSWRHKGHCGRTCQHPTGSENRIARGWNREDWSDAPDQGARMGRREKELLGDVTNAIRAAVE